MMEFGDQSVLALWLNMLYLLGRYAHIIAAMLLVGGFLFYEMVVPVAIADLKEETQIAVFARARWVFRWIIWSSVIAIILSGIYMTAWKMHTYIAGEYPPMPGIHYDRSQVVGPWVLRAGWWWAAHVISALLAIFVALHLVAGDRPPRYPLGMLRLDLMLLLIVVFFATVTRQVDHIQQERAINWLASPMMRYVPLLRDQDGAEKSPEPATAPITPPAAPATP